MLEPMRTMLQCRDLDETINFYTHMLDFTLVSEELEIEVWQETYVDVLLDAIIRRVQVTNRAARTRDLRHAGETVAPGSAGDLLGFLLGRRRRLLVCHFAAARRFSPAE